MLESKYAELNIEGMHYVREIKDGEGKRIFYILMSPKNKPIKEVYDYLTYRIIKKGDKLNSIKRTAYDLVYIYDFMMFELLTPELVDFKYLHNFIVNYLSVIDQNFRVKDCIKRSMLTRVPVRNEFRNNMIKVIDKFNSGGMASETICGIVQTVKEYFEYLAEKKKKDINLDDIFETSLLYPDSNIDMTSYAKRRKEVYTIKGILIGAGIKIRKKSRYGNPIDRECIFEPEEENAFLEALREENPIYRLYFYLLLITGLREAEARAIKYFDCPLNGFEFDFFKLDSHICYLGEDMWRVKVEVDQTNPPDLSVKFDKPREVEISDMTRILKSLLTEVLLYRKLVLKKKRLKEHNFLFINRNGTRLKYKSVYDKFYKILDKAGLEKRKGNGQLTIHSTRHTFASTWIYSIREKKGLDIDLDLLCRTLGHSSPKVTKTTYMHFFTEQKKELNRQMEMARKQRGDQNKTD
ncbi:tyrosine-type recombinase/integrase [Clostridium saccharoperbutylacetonicum]|uniref:tyrosine-type recombinase/integrase n=1 Tax=Clostridium saccharoperbutylacetonicum TaxID=36745 RepID=UPI0039EA6AC0